MSVMQELPTKSQKIVFVVMQMSACVVCVLLAALFITEGQLFASTLMQGFFAWTCVVMLMSIFIFVLLQYRPSSSQNK